MSRNPLALITGASRKNGIGSKTSIELSKNGWDIAITYWSNYDQSMPWGSDKDDINFLENDIAVQNNHSKTNCRELSGTES